MSFFPEHDVYVEPFGGSAAVLLQKPRSRLEVYNDLDDAVFNFFEVLRNHRVELVNKIKNTPFHSKEYQAAYDTTFDFDPIEYARKFYVLAYQSMLGPTVSWTNSFRRQKIYSRGKSGKSSMKPASHSFAQVDHLHIIAERLRGVTFENMDALQLMQRYDHPNTLFYLDPPYLGETRKRKSEDAYAWEMASPESHIAFLNAAKLLQGIPLISGYASDLYEEHLEKFGWTRMAYSARINGSQTALECLWLSPKIQDIQNG
jgi:DNA adenine methylase